MNAQLDLFAPTAAAAPLSPAERREIERFGEMDARCGMALKGAWYYEHISGEKRAIYEAAFRAELARLT